MKFGIVVFPGSNCDHDAYHVVHKVLGQPAVFLWHKDRDLQGADVVILPGGFAFGDYLRCGAIARFSPVMEEVVRFAGKGGKVLGICNGFQVLTEAGLLPGALLQNASCKFVCREVELMVENDQTPFSKALEGGQRIRMPVAHGDGNYFIDDDGLRRLEGEGRIVFRYIDNPNGSRANIAGIVNDGGNVLGLMPHPERASEAVLGGSDGRLIFESLLGSQRE
jgi:phosphoribosylformylglycinamidine synthase